MIDIEKALAVAEKELIRLQDEPFSFGMPFPKLLPLVSLLQLALRHQDVPDEARKIARDFIDCSIGTVERASPTLADFMRLGDDPAYDTKKT